MDTAAHIRGLRRRLPTTAAIWPALFLVVAVGCADAGIAAEALGGTQQSASITTSTMPRKGDIRNGAAAVGNHYRSAKPCPAGTCPITNKWDDAVLMMGVIEHWRKHGTAAYKTYAENWANANSWELFSDLSGDQRNPN